MTDKNILDRIRKPGSALQLALLRIAIGAQIFYAANSKIFDLLLAVNDTQGTVTIFPAFVDHFIAEYLVSYLVLATQILAGMMVFGLFLKVVLPLLFVTFLLLFSYYYMGANAPLQWLYFWFPLLVLSFASCGDRLSLDNFFRSNKSSNQEKNTYRWPVEMCVLWFVYIYFAAGIAKLLPLPTGIEWLAGGTSQDIIYNRFLDSPFYYIFKEPFFDYSSNHWVFSILSIGALLTELSTILLLFTQRYNLIILAAVTGMHFFLFMTGVAGFMQTALILGFALIPPEYFPDYSKFKTKSRIYK